MSDVPDGEESHVKRFKHAPQWARSLHWEWVMNVLLLLIALTIVGQTLYFRSANNSQNDCLQQQISTLTRALNARAEPADIERRATRDLIIGAIRNQGDPAGGKQLAQEYESALDKADRLRRAHPLPDYPTGSCDA